jgi:hypothetical protein
LKKIYFVFIYCSEQLNLKNISYWHYFTTKIMSICPIWNFTLYVTQSLHFFENHPYTTGTAWLFTQMHHKIILFLLFWDVLWIINDLLAPLLLFFHEFQQNSQVFTDNIKRSRSQSRRLQIYIKISFFKSLDIYK